MSARIAHFAVNPAISPMGEALTARLKGMAEVDVFHDTLTLGDWFGSGPPARPFSEYRAADASAAYDIRVYHMGDGIYFRDHYEMLISEPGIVVLHDWGLHRFHLAYAAEKRNLQWYVEEALYAHGEAGAEVAGSVIRGLGSGFVFDLLEMNRKVVDSSLAIISLDRNVDRLVRARFTYKPVFLFECQPEPSAAEEVSAGVGLRVSAMIDPLCGIGDLELVTRAFKRLSGKYDDVSFVLFGNYPEGRLKSVLRKYDAEGAISWESAAGRRRAMECLSTSDLFVHLRCQRSGADYGLLTQALAFGVPVVVYDRLEFSDIPDLCAFKIRLGGGESLPEVLERALQDRRVVREMGSCAGDLFRGRALSRPDDAAQVRGLSGFIERLLGKTA